MAEIQYKSTVVTGDGKEIVVITQIAKCSCQYFKTLKEKEVCMHIIWVLVFVLKIPQDDIVVQQIGYTLDELDGFSAM